MVVLALLLKIWSKSSTVRSAAVADFFCSVLETESDATDTTPLVRDGDNLFRLVRDRAVLKLRVAMRLAMTKGGGQEVKLATGASQLFEV